MNTPRIGVAALVGLEGEGTAVGQRDGLDGLRAHFDRTPGTSRISQVS